MTTPRARIWTSSNSIVPMAAAGQPGQQRIDTLLNLRTALDLSHLVGYTVVDTRVRMLIHTDDAETGTGFVMLNYGIGLYAGSIDLGDYPDLSLYEGDWFAYGASVVQLPGAINTICLPSESAAVEFRSRSSRRIMDVGQTVWFVFQENIAEGIDIHVSTAHLLLMP